MMGTPKSVVALLAAVVTLAPGIGSTGESTPEESAELTVEKACFRVRNTRSMSAFDDRHVYVRCIRDEHYLLTMQPACIGLENSIGVAVSNRFDRVCSNDGAWITYKDFGRTRRCGIVTVEAVADRNAALKLVEKRRKPAAEQRDREDKKKTAAPDGSGSRR
jgi:hypothetical protein